MEQKAIDRIKKTKTCWIWTGETTSKGYGRFRPNGGRKLTGAHRNELDNRRENLRVCTRSQNQRNRRKYKNHTVVLYGTTKLVRKTNPWMAQYLISGKIGGRQTYLGCYKTRKLAHEAVLLAKAILLLK